MFKLIEGSPAGFAINDEKAIGFCMKSIGILRFAVCFWLIPRLARGAFGGPKRAPDDPPPRKGPGRPRNLLFLIKDLQQNFSTKKWIFCDPPDPRWSGGFGLESVVCCIFFRALFVYGLFVFYFCKRFVAWAADCVLSRGVWESVRF